MGVAKKGKYGKMGLLSGEGNAKEEKAVRKGLRRERLWERKRGERDLKDFTKAVLYTYPILGDLEEAYGAHIKNKAVLSYKYFAPCEGLVEYIASEVEKREKLMWLQRIMDGVVDKLDETERTLLHLRYFRKRKDLKTENVKRGKWSESTYFRMQKRLIQRVENMLKRAGLTEQVFDEWFAPMQAFRYVCAYLQKGREGLNQTEKRLFH